MLSKELTILQKVGSSIVQIIINGRNFSLLCRNENSAGAKINKSHCLGKSSAKECKYKNSKSLFYNLIFVDDLRTEMDFIMYLKREIPEYSTVCLFAEESDQGGPVRRSGGRLGKIDAANEDGFFFKTDKSRLERIRRELRAKEEDEDEDEDDDDPPAKPQQKSGTK